MWLVQLWDVIIESPIHILSCRVTQNSLPAYSANQSAVSPNAAPLHHCETHPTTSSRGLHLHLGPLGHSGRNTQRDQPGGSSTAVPVDVVATHHDNPATTTMEQNMLFARLVAGEESPAGEHPPNYATALHDPTSPPLVPSGTRSGTTTPRSRSRMGRVADLRQDAVGGADEFGR